MDSRHAEINTKLEECSKITQETENQLQRVCRFQEYLMISRSHLDVYGEFSVIFTTVDPLCPLLIFKIQ